ncbi:MAG TPA: hypothetical protein VGD68_17210, partial [Streptosporangiaceae bacterium]
DADAEAEAEAEYPGGLAGRTLALPGRPAARVALPAPASGPATAVPEPAAAVPEPAAAVAGPVPEPAPAEVPAEAPVQVAAEATSPATAAKSPDDAEGPSPARPPGATSPQDAEGPSPARPPRATSRQDDDHLDDHEDEPRPPARPHPADEDTPPYGFPAVTGQVSPDGTDAVAPGTAQDPWDAAVFDHATDAEAAGAAEAADGEQDGTTTVPRMPTLLSAPVPADAATPAPADAASRGRPPAAVIELPAAEAELSHEDRPAQDLRPATETETEPAAGPWSPTRFERVRSTPTPPPGDAGAQEG